MFGEKASCCYEKLCFLVYRIFYSQFLFSKALNSKNIRMVFHQQNKYYLKIQTI